MPVTRSVKSVKKKPTLEIDVEVALKEESNITRNRLVARLDSFLKDGTIPESLEMNEFGGTDLGHDVESIKISMENLEDLSDKKIKYFIFKLDQNLLRIAGIRKCFQKRGGRTHNLNNIKYS